MSVVNSVDVFGNRMCGDRTWWMRKGGGEAEDVGDHPLMRGLATALPNVRLRLSLSYCGRRRCRPQSVRREFLYRGLAPTCAQQLEEREAPVMMPAPSSLSPK